MLNDQASHNSTELSSRLIRVFKQSMRAWPFLIIAALASGLITMYLHFSNILYSASALIETPTQYTLDNQLEPGSDVGKASNVISELLGIQTTYGRFRELMMSRGMFLEVNRQFNLSQHYNLKLKEATYRRFNEMISVEITKGNYLSVRVRDVDPDIAMSIANSFPLLLQNMDKDIIIAKAVKEFGLLEEQLKSLGVNVNEIYPNGKIKYPAEDESDNGDANNNESLQPIDDSFATEKRFRPLIRRLGILEILTHFQGRSFVLVSPAQVPDEPETRHLLLKLSLSVLMTAIIVSFVIFAFYYYRSIA